MQKNKYVTIGILGLFIAYFLFSQFYLKELGSIYVYVINPLFFIIMAIVVKFTTIKASSSLKYKKTMIRYAFFVAYIYIPVYLLSGIFLTYGRNPYSATFRGVLLNLYSMGTIIVAREFIRYRLINNVSRNDKKLIFIIIVITFTLQDFSIKDIIQNFNVYYIFKTLFAILIPTVIKNCLFTYMQMYTDYIPAIAYDLIINFVMILSPVLPNSPWLFDAILHTMLPLILLIYIMYRISRSDKEHRIRKIRFDNPRKIVVWTIIIILVLLFALGFFPIKPVGIATGSMEPYIYIGDVVFVQKCDENDIYENDVIEYKKDNYTVVHRVIKKYRQDGKIYFITKGDNNDDADNSPVLPEQITGKVIGRIPYLAIPTIWFKNITTDKSNVDVGLGK